MIDNEVSFNPQEQQEDEATDIIKEGSQQDEVVLTGESPSPATKEKTGREINQENAEKVIGKFVDGPDADKNLTERDKFLLRHLVMNGAWGFRDINNIGSIVKHDNKIVINKRDGGIFFEMEDDGVKIEDRSESVKNVIARFVDSPQADDSLTDEGKKRIKNIMETSPGPWEIDDEVMGIIEISDNKIVVKTKSGKNISFSKFEFPY